MRERTPTQSNPTATTKTKRRTIIASAASILLAFAVAIPAANATLDDGGFTIRSESEAGKFVGYAGMHRAIAGETPGGGEGTNPGEGENTNPGDGEGTNPGDGTTPGEGTTPGDGSGTPIDPEVTDPCTIEPYKSSNPCKPVPPIISDARCVQSGLLVDVIVGWEENPYKGEFAEQWASATNYIWELKNPTTGEVVRSSTLSPTARSITITASSIVEAGGALDFTIAIYSPRFIKLIGTHEPYWAEGSDTGPATTPLRLTAGPHQIPNIIQTGCGVA